MFVRNLVIACCVLSLLSCSDESSKKAQKCADLDTAKCETANAISQKLCRLVSGTCTEMKTCGDLTQFGQTQCKTDSFTHTKCTWLRDSCLTESVLLAGFKSKQRVLTSTTALGHSETADTFQVLTGQGGASFDKFTFDFAAGKSEVNFNTRLTAGSVIGTPYKFTYEAADIDADTMLITLKGTTPKTGTVFMAPNVDVVEPFERSLLIYVKSSAKLYFLLVYKQADMAKFSVTMPKDFIFDTGVADGIKDRSAEPHTALIFQ